MLLNFNGWVFGYGSQGFLRTLGKGALGMAGVVRAPGVLRGSSAFDYALKGQALIQKREFAGAVEAASRAVERDPLSDWAFGLLTRTGDDYVPLSERTIIANQSGRLKAEAFIR